VIVPGANGEEKRAIVFAMDGDKVWVADPYGGWGFDKAKVKPWKIAKDAKAGDAVLAAGIGGALVQAKVTKVEAAGISFAVATTEGSKKETRSAFAGDLGLPN
jgi:hypothetical protein